MNQFFAWIIIYLFTIPHLFAQKYTYDWHFTAGGLGADLVLDHTIDDEGNLFIVGNFEDDLALGNDQYNAKVFANSGFIAKLNAQGELLWSKEIVASDFSDVYPYSVVQDTAGNILVAGSLLGEIDADPSDEERILRSEKDDIYLSKFDPEGNLIWAHAIRGAETEERILDMHLDDEGMVYLGGYLDASTTGNDDEILLLKIDPTGESSIIWNYIVNTEGRIDGISELTFFEDHIYITGTFEGYVDFDATGDEWILDAGDGKDMFLAKLTKNAELVWATHVGGIADGQAEGSALDLDSEGNIYVSGYFDDKVDFDPGEGMVTLDGFYSTFLLKLDNEGSFIWVKDTDGFNSREILMDSNDQATIGIVTDQTLDLRQFDPSGDIVNHNELKVSGFSEVNFRKMTFNNKGDIFLSVSFADSLNYDPNSDAVIQTKDDWDFAIIKLKADAATNIHDLRSDIFIKAYPNPVRESLHIQLTDSPAVVHYQIVDLLGRSLYQGSSGLSAFTIPFPYPSGQYYVKLSTKDGSAVVKVSTFK